MVKWLLDLAQWGDLVLPLLCARQLERSGPTRHIFPVKPSASSSHVQPWVTTTSWPERVKKGTLGVERPSGPDSLAAEALSHKCCPSTPSCTTSHLQSALISVSGAGGFVSLSLVPVSSCPKGRTVPLVVLEIALITTEVREWSFGSYRASVKGTGVSSSCPSFMLLWHVFWFLWFWSWPVWGSYLSVLMVCSHGHSTLLQGFRGGFQKSPQLFGCLWAVTSQEKVTLPKHCLVFRLKALW